MIAVAINTFGVVFGTIIGCIIGHKIVKDKIQLTLMQGLGLVSVLVGAKMAVTADNDIVVIVSIILGGLLGETLRLEDRLNNMGQSLKKTFKIRDGNFINGFISASLMFCVGAMSIIGSIEAGLRGNNDILLLKSLMDFITAIILSSSLGIGVGFSGIVVFAFQGTVVLLANSMQSIFTDSVIMYMTSAGGLLISAIGINISGIAKDKEFNVINLLPGIFIAGVTGYLIASI